MAFCVQSQFARPESGVGERTEGREEGLDEVERRVESVGPGRELEDGRDVCGRRGWEVERAGAGEELGKLVVDGAAEKDGLKAFFCGVAMRQEMGERGTRADLESRCPRTSPWDLAAPSRTR